MPFIIYPNAAAQQAATMGRPGARLTFQYLVLDSSQLNSILVCVAHQTSWLARRPIFLDPISFLVLSLSSQTFRNLTTSTKPNRKRELHVLV
jgi:hypothetical protein